MEAILIIVPDSRKVAGLLAAIETAGAPGATVLDASGAQFLAWEGAFPGIGRLRGLEGLDREAGKAIISIVPNVVADAVVAAVERELDGFDAPFTGMLCTWSIGRFRCYTGDKPAIAAAAIAAEAREGVRS